MRGSEAHSHTVRSGNLQKDVMINKNKIDQQRQGEDQEAGNVLRGQQPFGRMGTRAHTWVGDTPAQHQSPGQKWENQPETIEQVQFELHF